MSIKIDELLRSIRTDLRKSMDGVVSKSMRDKGLNYKLNFGVSVVRVQEIAKKYQADQTLAEALWEQGTRELKILATLLYPVEAYAIADAQKWVEEIPNQEIREQVCKNLFQKLDFADQLVQDWTASSNDEVRATGYWLFSRLILTKPDQCAPHNLSQIIDRAIDDAQHESYFLRNSAQSALKFMGRISKKAVTEILNKISDFEIAEDSLKQEIFRSLNFEFSLLVE